MHHGIYCLASLGMSTTYQVSGKYLCTHAASPKLCVGKQCISIHIIDHSVFKRCDLSEFYREGKVVDIHMYVDSDHARGQSILQIEKLFLDICEHSISAVILKKQSTIETSVFGTEFITMKHGIGALRDFRNKLRMMGIPISSPSYIYGDSMSVVHNTSRPESV